MRLRSGLLLLLLLLSQVSAAELRCALYARMVRQQAEQTLGATYPWWYNLGQLQQESRCRADITAFDGGMGLAQFMPATAAAVNRELHSTLDPYKPADAIRLQATFLLDLRRQCIAPRLWASPYQAYNGGCGLLKREAARAGLWNHELMLAACSRRIITLKSGAKLDFCKVNYDYSRQIARYGGLYRTGPDAISFW